MLTELARREKAAGIKPDPDIDVYMKVRKTEVRTKHVWCLKINRIEFSERWVFLFKLRFNQVFL